MMYDLRLRVEKPGLMDENTAVQPADSVKNPVSLVECVQDCDGYVTGHDINY
jgi:hypothetical protein